jgi:hypothetical protein
VPESREDLETPRLVVPYVADGFKTLANHDLFLFDDRLVALKVPGAMRDAVKDERTRKNDERNRKKDERKRNAVGEPNRGNAGQRQRTQTEQRLAATRASAASLKSSESSDRIVIQLADVLSAKLSKRAWGVVVLRLQLTDGTKRSWRWMNNSQARRYTEAAPVLRDVFGSLLRE